MSKPTIPLTAGDRGVSELVGVVLLFGIVVAGSAMIFVSGNAVTDEVQAQSRVDAAESTFAEVDGTIQSLAQQRGSDTEAVDLGSVDPNRAEIRESGEMTITVNDDPACSATMTLSALEYADDGGTTVAYEGGAIWKRTESGLVTESSPELGFRNGSLQALNGTIAPSDDLSEGDTVTFTDAVTVSDSADDVTRTKEYEYTVEGINSTETETGRVEVTADVDGEETRTVEGEDELDAFPTKTVGGTKTVALLTRPQVAMALENATGRHALWGYGDLNGPSRSVHPGSYANFWVAGGSEVSFHPSFRECTAYDFESGNVTRGGDTYRNTSCSAWGSSLDRSSTVQIAKNGSTIDVPDSMAGQTALTEMLTVDGKRYYERAGGNLTAANLDSNQVLVFVEAADGAGGATDGNNVVLLVEVGQSTSEVSGEHLVNVEVTSVSAEDDDES